MLNRAVPCAAGVLLLLAQPLAAQEGNALRLEDLIPDSAVEKPEEWATDPAGNLPDANEPLLQPDSPLAEIPDLVVDWPDALELPPFEPLEAEQDARFAAENMPPLMIANTADQVRINSQLALAFPTTAEAFPIRDQFIDRFVALSNIKELAGDGDNIAQLAARARADQEILVELLRVYGYYDAQVIRTVGPVPGSPDDAPAQGMVRFDIIPGQIYRFGNVDLGMLHTAPDFEALRQAFEIRQGDPVSSDAIVAEKADLDVALGESGYVFAKLGEPDLLIDHQAASGDLTLPVDPAGKFAFGPVTSSLPDFLSGEHLQDIARFRQGDTYKRSLELDLRRAIIATGLVSAVSITPREVTPPAEGEPGVVAMDVALTKAPLRTIAGAIGYGSEEGIRVEASWEHRNLFPPEGSLKFRAIAGTREQLAGIRFKRNNYRKRDQILTLDAYASDIDTGAVDARTLALRGTFEKSSNLLFQKPFSWEIGAEVLASDERNRTESGTTSPRQTYLIGSVFGRATIDTSDSLLDPKKGFRLAGFVAPEVSRTSAQEAFYLRSQADASFYQSVSDGIVVAGRVRLASIQGADIGQVAPSRRLYAGGGASVRGYGYQAIGPRNDLGEATGGLSLAEASIEARIGTGLLDGTVSVVPFFDLGSVSVKSAPDFGDVKYGAGLGLRYNSSFGPIRVDVGVPLNPGQYDSPVAVYVSLGQAF